MKRKSPANNTRELIATLSDPKYLNMYRAFNKTFYLLEETMLRKILLKRKKIFGSLYWLNPIYILV